MNNQQDQARVYLAIVCIAFGAAMLMQAIGWFAL